MRPGLKTRKLKFGLVPYERALASKRTSHTNGLRAHVIYDFEELVCFARDTSHFFVSGSCFEIHGTFEHIVPEMRETMADPPLLFTLQYRYLRKRKSSA